MNNHPRKGSNLTMDPIRSIEDINSIKKLLSDRPRPSPVCPWNKHRLRTGDLLRLKVGQVKGLKVGETLTIREGKTGKSNVILINKSIYKVLKSYLETSGLGEEDYLFKSKKGQGPLQVASVNNLIKEWTTSINLQGSYGSHSMRKTWGFIQRTKFGVSWELICKRYKHSSPSVTTAYLGIEDKEVNGILLNEL